MRPWVSPKDRSERGSRNFHKPYRGIRLLKAARWIPVPTPWRYSRRDVSGLTRHPGDPRRPLPGLTRRAWTADPLVVESRDREPGSEHALRLPDDRWVRSGSTADIACWFIDANWSGRLALPGYRDLRKASAAEPFGTFHEGEVLSLLDVVKAKAGITHQTADSASGAARPCRPRGLWRRRGS